MMNEYIPRDAIPGPRGPEPTDPLDREVLGFSVRAPRHRRRSWGWVSMTVLAVVALVALAVLSGCSEPKSSLSPTGAASAQEEPQEATGEPSSPEDGAPVAEEPAEEPSPTPTQEVGAWGDTATYNEDDGTGLQVTLAAPEEIKEYDETTSWEDMAEWDDDLKANLKSSTPVRLLVTMKNNGTTTIDPSMASITVVLGDEELENDCPGEISCGTDLTKLRPGKSVNMDWAVWLPKSRAGEEITVEFNPNWDYDSTVWVGTYSK
jgi:hypothetical protein